MTDRERPEVLVDTLDQAKALTTGARATEYGGRVRTHERIGQGWAAILDLPVVTAEQVAAMMVFLKLVRSTSSPGQDSWVDAAGYAAIGAEAQAVAAEVEPLFPEPEQKVSAEVIAFARTERITGQTRAAQRTGVSVVTLSKQRQRLIDVGWQPPLSGKPWVVTVGQLIDAGFITEEEAIA